MSANMQIIGTHTRETTSMTDRTSRSRRARAAHVGLVLATAQLLTACSGMLDVSLPGNVAASALDQPSLATTLVDGAQADFECAFSQYVETTATWSNEVLNSSGGAEVVGWSSRAIRPEGGTTQCPVLTSNRGSFNVYMPLQIARGQAELAIEKLTGFTDTQVPGRMALLARANLYSAYAHLLLSEGYCQVAVDDGPLLTPDEGKAIAETRFTAAITAATAATSSLNNTAVLNAARLGRARARIALNKKTEAAADAKLIPANFVFNATYASTPVRRRNTVQEDINTKLHLAVAPAYRGLTFGGVPDPRVIAINSNRVGIDAFTPHWAQGKYTSPESPLPLATWDEAQLIIAEAEGGQSAIDAINRIHTRYGLPAYAGGTADEIRAQIIEERRRSLWLDGHQINDKLRFNIPFATGFDQKGVRYNDETCIQLPLSEMNGRT
jgi:starch-binding outer membrane protein, SusD/RagB family